jgi:hypothetical protein
MSLLPEEHQSHSYQNQIATLASLPGSEKSRGRAEGGGGEGEDQAPPVDAVNPLLDRLPRFNRIAGSRPPHPARRESDTSPRCTPLGTASPSSR